MRLKPLPKVGRIAIGLLFAFAIGSLIERYVVSRTLKWFIEFAMGGVFLTYFIYGRIWVTDAEESHQKEK